MIAARFSQVFVHTLLHYTPMPLHRGEEGMQVQIKSILHRCTVDFRDQPARAHERRGINPGAAADFFKFMRGAA